MHSQPGSWLHLHFRKRKEKEKQLMVKELEECSRSLGLRKERGIGPGASLITQLVKNPPAM